jgi:hypothetical protein
VARLSALHNSDDYAIQKATTGTSLTFVLLSLSLFNDSIPKPDNVNIELRVIVIMNGKNKDLERNGNGPFNLLPLKLICRSSDKRRKLQSKLCTTQARSGNLQNTSLERTNYSVQAFGFFLFCCSLLNEVFSTAPVIYRRMEG